MRTHTRYPVRPLTLTAAAIATLTAGTALGGSGSWTNAVSGDWSTGPWTGGAPNGVGETATFSHDWTGQTINVDGTFIVGSILATDTANNGGLLLSGGTLTLDNGVNKPVIQTSAGFTEPGGSSPFSNPLRITSVLQGSNGFEKTGPGYLSLESANTFTGNVKLTAASSGGGNFLRLTNDNNLGDTNNDIEVVANAQAVGLYASTGFTVTLNANRNIVTSSTSGTQDFWVKTKGSGNIIIDGVISGGTRFRKNDSGTATLRGANTFTGNTLIEGGTLVLSGGDNRLPSGSTVTMGSATAGVTLQINGGTQTLNGLALTAPTSAITQTISGTGTLQLQGSGNYAINTTVTTTSLDMSGLANFTFNRTSHALELSSNGASVVNTINLAKAGANTINAANVRFGGGANAAGQNVLIGLGQNNNINVSGEFVVGFFQGNGNVSFQSGLANPLLTIRGAGGGSAPIPLMTVGSTNSGNQPSVGILNLTGGSLDVIATELNVARHFANASGSNATGTLTIPAGTVVATTLNIASKANATTGAPTLTGTFNQSGGTVTATTLNLGINTNTEAPNLIANYNLSGGTLFASTIQGSGTTYGASTVRNLNLAGGTLRNLAGSDLSITGLAHTTTGRLNVNVTSASVVSADANRTVTIGNHALLSGSAGLTKAGDGTLLINSASTGYTGAISVDVGTLGGSGTVGGAVSVGGNATLAPGTSIGTLTTGNLSLAGTFEVEIDWNNNLSTLPASDQVVVNGTVTIGGGLQLVSLNPSSGAVIPNQTIVIIRNDGSDAVSGTFASIFPLSSPFFNYSISYLYDADGDGNLNDVAITFSSVPEPSMLGALAMASLALWRRRRRLVTNSISS